MSIDSHSFFLCKQALQNSHNSAAFIQDLLEVGSQNYERRFGTIFMIVPSLPDLKVAPVESGHSKVSKVCIAHRLRNYQRSTLAEIEISSSPFGCCWDLAVFDGVCRGYLGLNGFDLGADWKVCVDWIGDLQKI